MEPFSGLGTNLGNLARTSAARTRSISPENRTGERGQGGRAASLLGPGWKGSPNVTLEPGRCETLADIEGPGQISHIWMTSLGALRSLILRIYWEGQSAPSVECPLGDFFANAYGTYADLRSMAVTTGPYLGLNAYWPMPFRRRCRMTLENIGTDPMPVYWTIDYALAELPEDAAYFHAQFRRSNPLPSMQKHTILDGVRSSGHYVGTYIDWGVRPHASEVDGWWGEGEIAFTFDEDNAPTIVGTGTEDYFGGAWNFDVGGSPRPFSHPYAGMPHVLPAVARDAPVPYRGYPRPDMPHYGLYRWHIPDPIRFDRELKVQIQCLGLSGKGQLVHRQDDLASTAFWYQPLPTSSFPALPTRSVLGVEAM